MNKKTSTPYAHFTQQEILLRDHLAADRTILSNERTLLSYFRTSLTMFVAGISFIKFFNSYVLELLGWIFSVFAIVLGVLGFMRYLRMRKIIAGAQLGFKNLTKKKL